MDIQTVLLTLLLGGLMGLFGQGIRAAVGLKSMADDAKAQNVSSQDLFSAARFLISLLIGFLAGIAATLGLGVDVLARHAGDLQTLLTLTAAGYMGADFIEGFISKYLPGGKATPNAPVSNDGLTLLQAQIGTAANVLAQVAGKATGAISRDEIKSRLATLWQTPSVQESDLVTAYVKGAPAYWADYTSRLNQSALFQADGLALKAGDFAAVKTVGDLVGVVAAWYGANGWTVA